MRISCIACTKLGLDKDTIGINKKLLGTEVQDFYCMDCLSNYLDTSLDDLLDKIEEFKEEGCMLFE